MPRKSMFLAFAALLLVSVCAVSAVASDVLYTTLGPNGEYDTNNSGYFVDGANYYDQVVAMPFTPNATEDIADAVLALSHNAGSNYPVFVYLESDSNGLPGTVLAALTQQGTIPPPPGGLVTFNCNSCGAVNAGTQYWIVAQEADPNTQQDWMLAYQDQAGTIAVNDLGSIFGPWQSGFETFSGFRVDGSAVPEPGTLVMLGGGIVAVAAGIRRKINL